MQTKLKKHQSGNSLIVVLLIGFLVWGGLSLFSSDNSESYNEDSAYYEDSTNYENDGYLWAEENNVSSFSDCQDQFGTSSEEDECNQYVKEQYSSSSSFNGYECTEDCSGHEAGYSWAEENGISDEGECGGNSDSFIEGCISYVENNY
jgi:hypothetical protein